MKDGNFEFLGRADQQVKIRGIRVELDEIEDLLRRHEAIKDVAVIDRDDTSGNKYLCAYLALHRATETSEFRTYLSEQLPEYMVPSAFVVMEALPRTISGKVDRRALTIPGEGRAGLEVEYAGPRNPVEELLVSIWSQVLGISEIGIHDHFFN